MVMASVLQGLQHQAGVLGDVGLVGGRGDPTGADGGLPFMTHTVEVEGFYIFNLVPKARSLTS
jgi:hypothetical protein